MGSTLHITSGDGAGGSLAKCGLPGQERPDSATGLGWLACLALAAIRAGCSTPGNVYAAVAAADTPPQFWGDTTLWAKINAFAEREPPLVRIDGPRDRLPQWESDVPINDFRIRALPNQSLHAAADSHA
jgi:hypothetical protein